MANPSIWLSIRGANEIGLPWTHGDRHALVPVWLDGIPEDCPWVRVPGKVLGSGQRGAKRAGGQTADGLQELPTRKPR